MFEKKGSIIYNWKILNFKTENQMYDEHKLENKARTLDVQYLFGLLQRDSGLGICCGVSCARTSSTSPTSGLLACGVFLFKSFGQGLADNLRADDYYLHDIFGHGSNVVPRTEVRTLVITSILDNHR